LRARTKGFKVRSDGVKDGLSEASSPPFIKRRKTWPLDSFATLRPVNILIALPLFVLTSFQPTLVSPPVSLFDFLALVVVFSLNETEGVY